MKRGGDHVDALLAAVRSHVEAAGGELANVDELREGLMQRGRRTTPAATTSTRDEAPRATARQWLRPDAAGVRYSDVWIVETASGSIVLAHVLSHRRRAPRRNPRQRPRWYGVDILSGREVRIARVLDGSRR